jgi:arsenate reductase-like glutaredoxin family protein
LVLNIQIFGKSKSFDTKKAERFFKERGIKFQKIDILSIGLSKGEFRSIKAAVGLSAMIDESASGVEILQYLAYEEDKDEKLLDNPSWLRTPIVRNGKQATIGYCPDIWSGWK